MPAYKKGIVFVLLRLVNFSSSALPVILYIVLPSFCCAAKDFPLVDYRSQMRNFVVAIAEKARLTNPSFAVIPQNAQELITETLRPDSPIVPEYLHAISGIGREDLYFGYTADNVRTPGDSSAYMKTFCDIFLAADKKVLVTDYCSTHSFVDFSYSENNKNAYISFAADYRDLTSIPAYPKKPFNENSDSVLNISDAKNFLYLINPEKYSTKDAFVQALAKTNYDMFIIDLFYEDTALNSLDTAILKQKPNGNRRQLICYMSIGEAESYRYYWRDEWKRKKPGWLKKENPYWKGNYKVAYWDPEWQKIILGEENSYLQKILNAGFDGVYLDIIDAFEYFESDGSLESEFSSDP